MSTNPRGLLRGARDARLTLSRIRSTIQPAAYPDFIRWLERSGGALSRPLNAALPRSFRSLSSDQRALSPIGLKKELLWLLSRIQIHTDRLALFVRLRNDLESLIL